MNIIFTCNTYYPRNDGVQFVTQYLAEGLVKNGHKVTVVTNWPKDRTNVKNEIHNGVNIIRIDACTKHTFHLGDKDGFISIMKELCEKNDILINVCTQTALTDWSFGILDEIKIPKILYLHSIWNFKYKKENFADLKSICSKIFANIRWRFYYFINKNIFKKYNAVIQLHKMDYTYKFFKNKYNIDSYIIENAAEKSFFNPLPHNNISLPKKYIINVSNYQVVKNQMRGLKLFLNSNISNEWELIFIGSKKNQYYDKLLNYYNNYLNKENNPKKVHFLFDIPRKDIPFYVKNANLYFMTSKWEAFPISLTESMASKVPYISSNVGIVRFLSGGVVCNNDDEFNYWLNEFTNSEELRKQYGDLGYNEAVRKYNVDEKVKQLETILFRLVGVGNENL